MQAEIITIGDELLIGQVVDTNAAWLANQLDLLGFHVRRISSVPDTQRDIIQALTESAKIADLVLMTGGLGPTKDDITKKALSDYFGMPLKSDPEVLANIHEVIKHKAGSMNGLNEQQAFVPQGSTVIQNPVGTAPVICIKRGKTVYVSMPGVPFEMKYLMREKIIPQIKQFFNTPLILHKTVLTTGIPEAFLAERLESWENNLPGNIKLAYLPSPGRIRLRLSIKGKDYGAMEESLNRQVEKLYDYIPEAIFGFENETLGQVVGEMLEAHNWKLSIAESCTGGHLAYLVTSVPGASNYFTGGIVAYSNAIKIADLAVDEGILQTYGAVSKQTVEAMAKGAKNHFSTDFALAVSGIAGPGGGNDDKPVGTVWVGVSGPGVNKTQKFRFGDNRERNILRASAAALNMLRIAIMEHAGLTPKSRLNQKQQTNKS